MRLLLLSAIVMLSSCTSVQQVMDNKEVYCSSFYKGVRAVGRGALSATTGILVDDICSKIDDIVAEQVTPSDEVGA